MRSRPNCSLIAICTTLLAIIALTLSFAGANPGSRLPPAQKKSPSSPSASGRTPTQHTVYSGLWRTDGRFVSTAHIKNVLVTAPLLVTPVIYMADGTEYDLPAFTLGPGGISDLNVNDALRGAPSSVQDHLSESGTLVLRFTSQSAMNAAASMQILNEPQSLIFTISSRPIGHELMPSGPQDLESIWWKNDPGVAASVALFNASDAPKQLILDVSGSAGTLLSQSFSLSGKNTAILDLEPLIHELPGSEQLTGGVRITYEGLAGDIFATTTLANAQEGYSATSEFHPFHVMMAQAPPAEVSYGSVGLMVGAQDPMMGFPHDTRFWPYAALRNASARELNVKPLLFLMDGGHPRKVELPSEHFRPNEAKQLSFGSALSNFNGMATLTFSFDGHSGDLLMATGSVDQTGTYVFEVIPDGLVTTWAKNAPFWRVTGGFDSMLSVFNPQDAPEDIVLKLTYTGGTGHYAVPLHLAAGETQMLDVKDVIDMQEPDSEGNVIPHDVTEGSAQFAGPNGIAQEIRIGVSAGIFNVQTATCGGGCLICTSTTDAFISPNPIVNQVGASQQASALVDLSDGSQVDETFSASWGSSNTSIATVQAGLVNGIAPGSATISARFQAPSSDSPPPEGCQSSCPMAPFLLLASAPVLPVINSISPAQGLIGATTSSVTFSGRGLNAATLTDSTGGITATVRSSNDTTLVADLTVAANAAAGNHLISASAGGQTSNSVNFYIQVPTSIAFNSVSVLPDGISGAVGCPGSAWSGIKVDIKYQVLDQNSPGQPIQSSNMTPHEQGTLFSGTPYNNNIGPVSGYPTSSATTASDGTYHDVPFGACANGTFSSVTATQNITMIVGTASYGVRSQNWTVTGTTLGHGTIRNSITSPGSGSDVSASR